MSEMKELRDLFAHDSSEWKPIQDEGTTDMRFVAGDPWEPPDRLAREQAKRPCLSSDELSQYINQVVNEVRSNKRAVKFSPIGNGANDQTAEFYADKMREIEYRSRAQIAYTTAFQNAVERSYGWVRVCSRYLHPRAVAQDLCIDTVVNPNLITPDASAQMPDSSDMRHCWVREGWATDDFNERWSDNKITRYSGDAVKTAPDWISESRVFVGEYWKIKTKRRKLLIVNGSDADRDSKGVFEDDYDQSRDGAVLSSRDVDDPTVIQQVTNGLDILEETTWPGRYIPLVSCLGKVLYVRDTGVDKRKILSMVRLARDPQMLYAYLVTCEAELIGMTPKFPYFVYEGQLAPAELLNLAKSLNEPVAVIKVKPTIQGMPADAGPLPFPQRQPYEPPLAPIEVAKEAARRAIQAAMGQTPLPTAAQRRNEKSGVALKHIDELGQRGSFHFTDHYLDMITQVGIICEDLMGEVYDTPRDVGVRKADDTSAVIRINDPQVADSVSTEGDHLVTVSTGPSFDSEREAGSDFADTIISSPLMETLEPPKRMKLIAKAIKLKNLGAIGDEMADVIDPPNEQGEMGPEQMQQLAAENQALKQQMQQAGMIIQTKQVEQQGKVQIASMQEANKLTMSREKNETSITVAELGAKVDRMMLFLEERARLGADQHEASMAAADAGHEERMARIGHQQAMQAQQAGAATNFAMGERGHQQALEAGDVGHQQQMQQAEQAASLAPQPEPGA